MTKEETAVVRFHATKEKIAEVELGEIMDIEDNPNNVRMIAMFMSRFVVDADGNYLSEDEARRAIRRVTLGQLQKSFTELFDQLKETAVPNE